MLTVYKLGFSRPVAAPVPTTSPLTYLLLAAAGWWAWKRGWFKGLTGGTAA
jgi:hypothetical protein